jgi:hypothetical protein
MSTRYIFYTAIVVFTLMLIGVVLTALEFKRAAGGSTPGAGKDRRQ